MIKKTITRRLDDLIRSIHSEPTKEKMIKLKQSIEIFSPWKKNQMRVYKEIYIELCKEYF